MKTWRPLTSRVFVLAVAFALWEWARPSLSEAESLRPGWILIECNYGGLESPLDELIGSFHDGTPEGDEMVAERLRRLSESRPSKT